VRTVFSGAPLDYPIGLCLDPANARKLFVACYKNHIIASVDARAGTAELLLGKDSDKGLVDGTAQQARFQNPRGVQVVQGVLYVADCGNHRVRRIAASNRTVSTVAGTGERGNVDGPGAAARFDFPEGVAVDGAGTLVTADAPIELRTAGIDDVPGILELIAPLEESGALVRRSREQLELEIGNFSVITKDASVIACAALYPYPAEHVGEIACVAVHPDYEGERRGAHLLQHLETHAREGGLERLFVLTTRTAHWFREQGFTIGELTDLPVAKRHLYNYRRNSKVFFKTV